MSEVLSKETDEYQKKILDTRAKWPLNKNKAQPAYLAAEIAKEYVEHTGRKPTYGIFIFKIRALLGCKCNASPRTSPTVHLAEESQSMIAARSNGPVHGSIGHNQPLSEPEIPTKLSLIITMNINLKRCSKGSSWQRVVPCKVRKPVAV
ncbi:MAG: hypothetical protein ABJ327_04650 [Litoreibacter sp.]